MHQNGGNTAFIEITTETLRFKAYWEAVRGEVSTPYGPRVDRYVSWVLQNELQVSPGSLQGWLEYQVSQGASASTVCGYYFACKVALQRWSGETCKALPGEEAAVRGWTMEQELKRIRLPKVMKGKRAKMIAEFQASELDKVIRSTTPRIGAYIEFLADTGLRVQEMVDIRLGWVRQYDQDWAHLTVKGKGDRERAVPVQTKLIARVRRIFHGQVFLFETKTGRQYDPDNIRKEIKRTFIREAGIGLTPHNLRHYLATRLLRLGISPRAVADLLGQSPTTTALSYDVSVVPTKVLETSHHGERGKKKNEKGD